MINLREYRTKAAGLEDYIPWCVMIEDGIILNTTLNLITPLMNPSILA